MTDLAIDEPSRGSRKREQAIPNGVVASFNSSSEQGTKYASEVDSGSSRYYGFLSEIVDVGDAKWSAQFEIVPLEWMETAVLGLKGSIRSQRPASPAGFFVFDDAALNDIANALSTSAGKVQEGGWYILTLGNGELHGKRKRRDAGEGPTPSTTGSGQPVRPEDEARLTKRFRPTGRVDLAAIERRLQAMAPHAIGVMDVGAAGCNLVYDGAGMPLVYVDVGIPLFPNYPSRPPANSVMTPGPCLFNNPPVILTHWHWDHYSMVRVSANRNDLRNLLWVVPDQQFGPVADNNFAGPNQLTDVHVWPAGLPNLRAGRIHIIRCIDNLMTGNRNNSGLAVEVTIHATDRSTHTPALSALLPGDAAFQCIPGVGAVGGLRWMAATHHGSDTNIQANQIPAPNAANQGRLAYSYGIMPGGVHCYGHPRVAAIHAYHARGWGAAQEQETATAETGPNSNVAERGNILMCNNIIPPPCGNPNCPFHVFPKTLA